MKGKSQLRTWFVGMTATLMILVGVPCAAQMTLTVDTLDDVVDEYDGYLSLREALEGAGTYDTIEFDPVLLPGTIYLDPAVGTLFVDQDVTIAGPGPELLTINGQAATAYEYCVFSVGNGYTMTDAHINGLTITRGGSMSGGAVMNLATLTMSDIAITDCQAEIGGAIANVGEMTISDSVITDCQAFFGGAVFNAGAMSMTGCQVSENSAEYGGAVGNVGVSGMQATLAMDNCDLRNNGAAYFGGALINGVPFETPGIVGSDVTLSDCSLTWNIVYTRDYSESTLGAGGAIGNIAWGYDTNLTVDSCILNNNAAAMGGAIANVSYVLWDVDTYPPRNIASKAVANIVNSTLTDNLALVDPDLDPVPDNAMAGGAVVILAEGDNTDSENASVTIDRSTLDNNAAVGQWTFGGAIAYSGNNANTFVNITNSTVSNNSSEGVNAAMGGALVLMSWEGSEATVSPLITKISNSTLSGNSAVLTGEPSEFVEAEAGCIYNMGELFLDNCTLADNVDVDDNPDVPPSSGIFTRRDQDREYGGAVSIKNTILANDPSGKNINSDLAEVLSYGYNISTDDSWGFLDDPTDMINTDPMLGLLDDNGGPTKTHALMVGSAAIDTASATDIAGNPVDFDQRGVVRPYGSANDIGAVEMEQVSALEISEATVVRERRTTVVTILVTNGQTETALNSKITTATLGGISCVERLPMRLGTIVPGNTKERQLTFKDVPFGEVTLVIEGTSSLGEFWSTQTVLMP